MKDITPIPDVSPLVLARRVKGMTREDLASRSGLSFKTIERLERGRTAKPHRATARVIAQALECEPGDIWPDLELAA